MPVTQIWCLSEVPAEFERRVSDDFHTALVRAERNYYSNRDRMRAYQNWCEFPEDFLVNVEAYDIHRRHRFLSPSDFWSWKITQQLFSVEEFDALIRGYISERDSSLYNIRENYVIDFVHTSGDTALSILFYMLGEHYSKELPGFFGNFFVPSKDIEKESNRIKNLFHNLDRNQLVAQGEKFSYGYNDKECIEKVFDALPNALQEAKKRKCGLLGLKWTAG